MLDPVKRAIVSFPVCKALPEIEALRAAHDSQVKLIQAHLTLVFPFESALTNSEIADHLRLAVVNMQPFRIRLRGITGSEGEYLFLNVKQGNDALIELHDRLYSGVLAPFLSPTHTFVPHLTVGRIADPVAFRSALEQAQVIAASLGTIEAEVHDVTSYLINADGEGRIEYTAELVG